jgi:hypothetical protein
MVVTSRRLNALSRHPVQNEHLVRNVLSGLVRLNEQNSIVPAVSQPSDRSGFPPVEKFVPRITQPMARRVRRATSPSRLRFHWLTSVAGLTQHQESLGKLLAGSEKKTRRRFATTHSTTMAKTPHRSLLQTTIPMRQNVDGYAVHLRP